MVTWPSDLDSLLEILQHTTDLEAWCKQKGISPLKIKLLPFAGHWRLAPHVELDFVEWEKIVGRRISEGAREDIESNVNAFVTHCYHKYDPALSAELSREWEEHVFGKPTRDMKRLPSADPNHFWKRMLGFIKPRGRRWSAFGDLIAVLYYHFADLTCKENPHKNPVSFSGSMVELAFNLVQQMKPAFDHLPGLEGPELPSGVNVRETNLNKSDRQAEMNAIGRYVNHVRRILKAAKTECRS